MCKFERMKAEPSRTISRKLATKIEPVLLLVESGNCFGSPGIFGILQHW